MKNNFLVLLIATVFATPIAAQNSQIIGQLEAAERILDRLMDEQSQEVREIKGGQRPIIFRMDKVESTYLDGFGALFTLGAGLGGASSFAIITDDENEFPSRKERKERAWSSQGQGSNAPVDNSEAQQRFKDLVENFLMNYAFTLRSLPKKEKIMIRNRNNKNEFFGLVFRDAYGTRVDNETALPNFSASVVMEDVLAFQGGKINKGDFQAKIKYDFQNKKSQENKDAELLSDILEKIYDNTDNPYFELTSRRRIEHIEGVGVIFNLYFGKGFRGVRVLSGSARIFGEGIIVDDGENGGNRVKITESLDKMPSMEELGKDIDEEYPTFLKQLKENLISYGSIVKGLKEDEALVFNVSFQVCPACKVRPERTKITIKQKTLENFRTQKIPMNVAMSQLMESK